MKDARKYHDLQRNEFEPNTNTPHEKRAFYIADHFLTVVKYMLRLSRDFSKMKLFDVCTHLLFDWKRYAAFVYYVVPDIRFFGRNENEIGLSNIPDCVMGSS